MTIAMRSRPDPHISVGLAPPSDVNPIVRAALYGFVFSIPFEMPHRTIPIEIPTLTAVLFLLSTALHPSACFRRIPAAVLWFVVYLWFFVLASAVNQIDHPGLVLRLFLSLLQMVLFLWVGYNVLRDRRARRGALLALVTACVVRAVIQIAGIAATPQDVFTGGARVTVLGQNANLSAMILSAGLAALMGLSLGGASRLLSPAPAVLLAAPLGIAIIQTGSRGGLLGAGIGLAAFLLRGHSLTQWLRNTALAAFGVFLLAWGALQSPVMQGRLERTAAEGHLAGRERIYPAVLAMFAERPLRGWGPIDNQFEIAARIDERRRPRRDAHNLLLELLTTTGIPGTVPFLIGLSLCVRGAWRARHGRHGLLYVALLAAVLAGTVTGTWIVSKILWLALALALAAGHTVSNAPKPDLCRITSCAA